MGCINGKPYDDLPYVEGRGIDIITHNNDDNHDRKVIEYIKNQIDKQPEWFLLNNLLMSFVFFRNYEKELYDFSNTAIPKEEQDLDAKLKPEVKKCILPGVLLDKIQENVSFFYEESVKNDKEEENTETIIHEEPISHKTIYVVNNNIEVSVDDNGHDYTHIAVPGCRVITEEISEKLGGRLLIHETKETEEKMEELNKQGFLRLKVITNSSASIKENQLVERKENMSPQTNEEADSKTSEEKPTIEDEEYSYIIALNTPKNIDIKPTTGRRDTLPEDCFKKRKIKKIYQQEQNRNEDNAMNEDDNEDQETEDSEEEEDQQEDDMDTNEEDDEDDEDEILEEVAENEKSVEPKKNAELYENLIYLSSQGFMEYFQSEVFPNAVGELLGFSIEEIKMAKALPGYILCDKKDGGKYKIIPAVHIDWPLQAKEFINRESRKAIHDEKKWAIYKWPTDNMVEELKKLNCVVIPKGFVSKKDVKNPDRDIEWEIHFPKTERFLEIRLTHAQVRCYMFLIALFKTFIEKETTHRGFVIDHIRTHIFWESEKDAKSWPEHKMGIKILQVIKDLNTGLSRRKIPDYFIKDKNIFENIPSMYIQFAQKVFHDVIQFPVMHLIEALKNFKFVQEDFYPVPDLKELKRLLTDASVGLPKPKVIKKSSFKSMKMKNVKKKKKKKDKVSTRPVNKVKKTQAEQDLEWKKRHEMNIRKKHIKMLKELEEKAAKEAKALEENRSLKISFTNLEVLRQKEILQFFIDHFIEIVRKSKEIGPKNQSLFYLKQAWYNLKVLEDIVGSSDQSKEVEKIIAEEHDQLTRQSKQEKMKRDIAPPTPRRNKDPSVFSLIVDNSERKPSKLNNRSISDASTSRNKDSHLKEKRVRIVAFDETVQEFNA